MPTLNVATPKSWQTVGGFDRLRFQKGLVDLLLECGVEPGSPFLPAMHRMIDDNVAWYLSQVKACAEEQVPPLS